MKLQAILHPTDYTDVSDAALLYAVELARDYDARLVILHAVETLGPENVTYGEAMSQLQPQSYRRRLWEDLRRHEIVDAQVHVEYILSERDPVSAILDAAAEHHCDLIVLGSHLRQGLLSWLAGSVAQEVVRKASCPVLVVKGTIPQAAVEHEESTELHPQHLTQQNGGKGM